VDARRDGLTRAVCQRDVSNAPSPRRDDATFVVGFDDGQRDHDAQVRRSHAR
jgi:hypothetical protein